MKKNNLLMITMLFIPNIAFAANRQYNLIIPAIAMEAFITIHMSLFVLKPLSDIITKGNGKKLFFKLSILRIIILLFFDFFITPAIAITDFYLVFIGAFIIIPIQIKNKAKELRPNGMEPSKQDNSQNKEINLKCSKCGNTLKIDDKFCANCGEPFDNVVTVTEQPKVFVNPSNFDPIYNNATDDVLLERFIKKELDKLEINLNEKPMTQELLKRKNILNTFFSILLFIYISLIFFHFPIYTYLIGIILLFIFYKITKKYNLIKFIKKEIKSRPNEKISNIIMNIKNNFVYDNLKYARIGSIALALLLPLIIFKDPRIMYEEVENGYAVRFYTFGITNFETATIPAMYNGKPVVSLRGNSFSNMPFLKSVSLPNTITKIRGQAFKNDINLVEVNIPNKLEYLGGGSFYNCKKIKNITLPDTLTYMGGEVFYNATSLEYVKLSSNLSEIRGNSFEYCTSLKSIEIPDNITRIGGHAFYGDTNLSTVTFTENSKLKEIGSSAFRLCTNLKSITLPKKVIINERSFKESPTKIHYFE